MPNSSHLQFEQGEMKCCKRELRQGHRVTSQELKADVSDEIKKQTCERSDVASWEAMISDVAFAFE
jgi:hypothetical protein